MSSDALYLLNDSDTYGGAEVYTQFFAKALAARGYRTVLLVSPRAQFWQRMDLAGVEVRAVTSVEEVEQLVPTSTLLINHGVPAVEWLRHLKQRGNVVVVAHHVAAQADWHAYYGEANLLFVVSKHVLQSCHEFGYGPTYDEPLLGVGEMKRGIGTATAIEEHPRYIWETRKGRDWLLSKLHPLYWRLRRPRIFARRPGTTLGIVSRIAPIKQFALLLEHIAPVLAKHPEINLEIFGSGKYSLVRAVERAVRPLGDRVRYWGWQWDVASIYPHLDYLLTGLPEREALGLNVIEAQFLGTPVLAVDAPPFTETMIDGSTGYLFRDPREDNGADFDRVLTRIVQGAPRPDPRAATEHLSKFTFESFATRVQAAVEYARRELVLSRSVFAESDSIPSS